MPNIAPINTGRRIEGEPDVESDPSTPAWPTPEQERIRRDESVALMDAYASGEAWRLHCDEEDPEHDFDGCAHESVAASPVFVQEQGDADPIDPKDVQQGKIADCFFLAALSAVVATPEGRQSIRDAIVENKDAQGRTVSYTVTLHQPTTSWWPGATTTFRDVRILVSPDLAQGHAAARTQNQTDEVWPAVMEAAFARSQGGYDAIAHGGEPHVAMQLLTGRRATRTELTDGYGAAQLQRDVAAGKLVVLATKGGPLEHGLTTHHSYSVTGIEERNGQKVVTLRNPWGFNDPEPVPLAELGTWFHAVDVGSVG